MRACNCARASPFQSRTCVGCDLVILYQRDVLPVVSIHAPAWGATPQTGSSRPVRGCFNPRTRVGCDGKPSTWPSAIKTFQSTHPRGVRQSADTWPGTVADCFNPRTRVGCDGKSFFTASREGMFQSTHPRGVRPQSQRCNVVFVVVSIHAPAWGATPPDSR